MTEVEKLSLSGINKCTLLKIIYSVNVLKQARKFTSDDQRIHTKDYLHKLFKHAGIRYYINLP
jgi:hypothetical protein